VATKTLSIVITGEDKGGKAILDKTSGDVGKFTADVEGKFTGMGTHVRNALIGIGAVAFGRSVVAESQEAEKAAKQTEAVIKSTGGTAHVTAGQIGDLANAISKKTGVDDEQIQAGENMLLTFTRVRNEAGKGNDIFNQATQVAQDFAAATGSDLVSANLRLGKALNDPIAGMQALSRVGVQFDTQQKEQIKTLVKSGDILGAQKIILAEVTKEFGGSAAAQATDLDKAKVSWKNFEESVGTALAPGVDAVARFGGAVADAFSALPQWAQTGVSSLAVFAGGFAFLAPKVEAAWATVSKFLGGLDVAKLVNTKTAVESIGTAGEEASVGLSGILGPIALVAAGVGLIWSQTKGFSHEVDLSETEVTKLQIALEHLGATGKTDLLGPVLSQFDKFSKAKIGNDPFGAKDALDALKPQLKALDDEMVKQINGGHVQQYQLEIEILRQKWIAAGGNVQWLNDHLDKSGVAYKGVTQAAKDNATGTSEAASALDNAKVGTEEYNKALSDARTELDKFDSSLNTVYKDLNRGRDSVADYYAATDALSKSLKENGWTWALNTEQGRKNNEAMEKAQGAILGVADAKYHETGRTQDAIAAANQYIFGLAQTLQQAGYTQDQINGLLFTYGLTPPQINTHILTSGTPQAISDAQGVQSAVNNIPNYKNIDITFAVHGISAVDAGLALLGQIGRAGGGPVHKGQLVTVNENEEEWIKIPGGRQRFMAPFDSEIRTNSQMYAANSFQPVGTGAPAFDFANPNATGVHIHVHAGMVVSELDLGRAAEAGLRKVQQVTGRQVLAS